MIMAIMIVTKFDRRHVEGTYVCIHHSVYCELFEVVFISRDSYESEDLVQRKQTYVC